MITALIWQEPNVHLENTNTPNLKALDTDVNIVNIRVDYENSLTIIFSQNSVKYVHIRRLSKGSRTEQKKVAYK